MMVGVATAQSPEQVLPSTPIYATAVAESTPQQLKATKTSNALAALPPFVLQNTSGYAVGATPVNSGVSPTGAFTYEVPIAVPPGVQDVQPNIALTYNSQSGNGLAGWGWNISGLSTISRVGSTLHHDGVVDAVDFDGLDRFALDGQRLIVTSGTYGKPGAVYTTENYANIKITSYGTHPIGSNFGPKIFVVHYPDGSKAYYGYSSLVFHNGRIRNASSSLEWVITKWEDAQGNQMHYSYAFSDNTGGTLRVTKIAYGGNEVVFHYKNRSRHETSFVGGQSATRKNILSYIEVKSQGSPYRKYTLRHHTTSLGYQKVTQLQETDRNGVKRMPVVFSYQSDDDKTTISGYFSHRNLHSVGKKTTVLTGNFDYDANLDAVTYDAEKKNYINVILGIASGGTGKINVGTAFSVPRFEDIFPSTLLANGEMLSQQGITMVREHFSNNVSSTTFATIVMAGIGPVLYSPKKWIAPTYTDYLCNDIPIYDAEPKDYNPLRIVTRKIPKSYVSGDFNGDGLTDVLAINKGYSQTTCNPPIPNCRNRHKRPLALSYSAAKAEEQECDCRCDYRTVNGGTTHFIDLDQRKTSNFAVSVGNVGSISQKDQLFAADFDGDGKSDLWHIKDKKIAVYTLVNNQLKRIAEYSDDWIKTDNQILKGDFNGDGKLDLLAPKANDSKDWRFFYATGNSFNVLTKTYAFSYKKGFKQGVYLHEYFFIVQDIDQDGKSDILRHHISSRSQPYGYYPDGSKKTEYYNHELLEIYLNKSGAFERGNYIEKKGHFYDGYKYLRNVKPIYAGLTSFNKKMQYAVLSGSSVKRYAISTPHKGNMRLTAVTHHGVQTKIDYASLDATNYGSIYQRDTGLQYPFVHINHAPGMELVSKLTQSVRGHTRIQQFKYKGAVSHMRGLGFMGFTGLARSNLYGDNVAALWTVSKQDPKLRGATTEQWTDPSYAFNRNCYISKTVTGYHTELRPNKVYVSVPNYITTHNNLTGVLHERFFTYDRYFNLETEREKTEGLNKTTTYRYYNNPSPTDANYHIGRLRWEKTLAKVPGAADFWTEKDYSYQNNLLKTEKVRANGSNWRSTTYTYTHHGNVETKTLSVPGKPARTESFTYYPNGRDLRTHTDVLGLTTSYEYYPYGALKKETDPYGNSTQYTYDGWNRLHKTTNYLGRVTEVTYASRSYGGVLKTINHPYTAADTRTYYNALGWIDEVHTQISSSQWSKVYYQRDVAGRVRRESVPDFYYPKKWNVTEYDLYGRIALLQEATGRTIHTDYDGLRTQVSDGTKTATTTKNALDQIVELADPGGTIRYAYHANGELRQADYGGYVVSTEIDNWGRKNKLIDPTAGTFGYKHNDWGELLEETAPKGKTVYRYDAYGRMTQKDWTGSLTNMKTAYVYTPDTKLLDYVNTTDSQNNTTHRITYSYDAYKRINKLHEAGTHANFAKNIYYDYYGRVYSEQLHATDNKSKKTYKTDVTYSYNTAGVTKGLSSWERSTQKRSSRFGRPPVSISVLKSIWNAFEYNALGQVKRSQSGNFFTQTKTIDAFGFVSRVRDYKSGASAAKHYALNLSYTFDTQRGLLTARSDHLLGIENQRFVYDNMDRLTEAHHDRYNQTRTRTRGYDPRGRLTQDTFMGINLTYGSGNDRYRLTGAELNPNGVGYYNKHKDRKLTYNADRKPVEVHDVGNGRITFHYSHDGHRQEVWYGGEDEDKTKRKYHKTYSRIAPIELVRDTENNTQKFLTYLGGDAYSAPVVHVKDTRANSPNGHHYLHRDYLGSILAVSNNSGEVIERAHFGAWGDETDVQYRSGVTTTKRSDSLTGRGFTGHEHFTEVGLVHMNGRMYDPMQGRFLSPDNHIQDPFNTQNFNRYGYVLNNPLSLTDPSGEFFWFAVAIGAFFGGATAAMQGGDFWDILGGALIGGIAGGLGAGLGNLAAQGLGFASTGGAAAGFFGNAALSVTGFGAGFTVGFVGGFASGFVGAAGNAMLKGQKFGKSLLMGLKAGFFSGVAAGVLNGVSAGLKATKNGGNFWSGKRPEVNSVSTLKPQGIEPVGLPKPKGDLSGLEAIDSSNSLSSKLNPDNFQLSNPTLRAEVENLYGSLVEEVGHTNFEFKVTGGDRYIGSDGKIYSSTDNSWVQNSKISSKHLIKNGARAVDLRIRGISEKTFYQVLDKTNFHPMGIFDGVTRYTRKTLYPIDRHTHIFLK